MTTIFVYAKDGKIKVLGLESALDGGEDKLKSEGYTHTATIDPCRFIEYLCNESKSVIADVEGLLRK